MGLSKASRNGQSGNGPQLAGPALSGMRQGAPLRAACSGNESSTLHDVAGGRVDTFARVTTITF